MDRTSWALDPRETQGVRLPTPKHSFERTTEEWETHTVTPRRRYRAIGYEVPRTGCERVRARQAFPQK